MLLDDVQTFAGMTLLCQGETVLCNWLAGCERDATDTIYHPILKDVPACASCKALVDAC